MDIYINAFVAVLFSIISAVVALIMKKPILKVLGIALAGLVLGTVIGYALAPTILSFW